ncbi:MAG: HD-GYP domain-containing protein [Phycisphaerales bacterium JB061]
MSSLTTLESDINSRCVNSVGTEIAERAAKLGFRTLVLDTELEQIRSFDLASGDLLGSERWHAVLRSKQHEWSQGKFRGGTGVRVYACPISRRHREIGCVFLHRFLPRVEKNALFTGILEDPRARKSLDDSVAIKHADDDIIASLLKQSINDLVSMHESDNDVEDLSHRLSEAYETLEVLYALGRSMVNIDKPEKFVVQACHRIREALGFGFVAMHVGKDMNILPASTIWEGDPDTGPETIESRDRLLNAIKHNASLNEWDDSLGSVVRAVPNAQGSNALIVAGDKQTDGGHISSYDTKLIEASARFTSTFLSNAQLFDIQKRLFVGIVESLSAAIDAKDAYTEGHSRRVAYLAEQIALNMGLTSSEAERVRISGLLHDVGKIGVPEAVLCKPGRLTDEEFEDIKKHPEIGHRILKDLTGLEDVLPGVLHHHERYDGRGYPHGLAGEDIPMMARILACADTFDAMSSNRSYRSAMPREKVLAEVDRCRGTQFDSDVVTAFLKIDLTVYDSMVAEEAATVQKAA